MDEEKREERKNLVKQVDEVINVQEKRIRVLERLERNLRYLLD